MPFVFIDHEMAFDVDFGHHRNRNVFCPFHEDADSLTPSCSVSIDGLFNCKVCAKSGTSIAFYAARCGISHAQAATKLDNNDAYQLKARKPKNKDTSKFVKLTDKVVAICHQDLLGSNAELDYLHGRGITDATIKQFMIGRDETRITLPIWSMDGSVRDVKRSLPGACHGAPKMVHHRDGDGSPYLYPVQSIGEPDADGTSNLILCEGEYDALLLITLGFTAITNTGNAAAWDDAWNDIIEGFIITIIYDVNDTEEDYGQRMAQIRAEYLYHKGFDVRVVVLPIDTVAGDITDYFINHNNKPKDLRKLIDDTPMWEPEEQPVETLQTVHDRSRPEKKVSRKAQYVRKIDKPIDVNDTAFDDTIPFVTIQSAADAEHYYRPIRMRCLLAGKGTAPYIVPKTVHAYVVDKDGTTKDFTKTFDPSEDDILNLIDCTDTSLKRALREMLGIKKEQQASLEVIETMNIEEIFLIPPLDDESAEYALRRCYYIGRGLRPNNIYEFKGYTLPHPKTQIATHILTHARPSSDSLDAVVLDKTSTERLRKTFAAKDVHSTLERIADELADHVTHIYERPDLHIVVDLTFHSPLSFMFDGHLVRKGWLELLVLGDTRTGKGCVVENLIRHYGAGEVVSGENVTVAGLVGGIQKVGDRYTLTWGRIPLNDRRLVVIDEASALSQDAIGRLSRIRSEGIAEITKIITEKTTARTRLIWLSNPRPVHDDVRMIADYHYGVDAVLELVGAAEDVARFDMALIIAQDEVSSEEINASHVPATKLTYTSTLCRELLIWTWSRKEEHIRFTDAAVKLTYKAAQHLGRQFSPKVCLIQGEDVRFKLARIAAASACRTFNTKDGEHVDVETKHVEFAYNLLVFIYSTRACGYAAKSAIERERAHLRDPKQLAETMIEYSNNVRDVIDGLLETHIITRNDLADYGGVDGYSAGQLISSMVRHHAILKQTHGYVLKPAFRTFLMRWKSELSTDEYTTENTDDPIVGGNDK